MILSNECYLKDTCNRFKNGKECPGDFCIKLFKQDCLFNEIPLTQKQRERTILRLDANRCDESAFSYLKSIEDNIQSFIDGGNNLYIYSSITGNGKTEWSLRLIQSYINKIWYKEDVSCKALFINVPRFLLSLKDNISEKNDYISHIKENILTAKLVVWDDIATKGATEYESENLLSMINSRIDLGLSNIYTANILPENLEEILGARLCSRIINMSTQIKFVGADKRNLR